MVLRALGASEYWNCSALKGEQLCRGHVVCCSVFLPPCRIPLPFIIQTCRQQQKFSLTIASMRKQQNSKKTRKIALRGVWSSQENEIQRSHNILIRALSSRGRKIKSLTTDQEGQYGFGIPFSFFDETFIAERNWQ